MNKEINNAFEGENHFPFGEFGFGGNTYQNILFIFIRIQIELEIIMRLRKQFTN